MTERSDADTPSRSSRSLVDVLRRNYHVIGVAALMVYMFWVRIRSYDRFVLDGQVFFRGNDAYYHLREVTYTVEHWPETMPWDPWTYFPFGTSADQFGTLFDQLIATGALVVGLGSPSQELVAKSLLLAPPILGALTAIPVYFIGRRLGGRIGGLFGVVVLALLPGSFLQRSLVGFGDHHVAESLFMAIAVLAVMVALAVAERDKPVYELVVDRDAGALRAPVGWAALAGIALALYVWTWPPAVLLTAILGVFYVVKMTAAFLDGKSPEPVGVVGIVSMTVAGVMMLVPFSSLSFSPTSFGLLQPLAAFAVAGACLVLAWLAREWEGRDLDRQLYPAAVFGVGVVGVAAVALLLPDLFDRLTQNYQRFVGFSAAAEQRTISEAKPFLDRAARIPGGGPVDVIFNEYGAMFFTAMVGAVYILGRPLLRDGDVREYGLFGGAIVAAAIIYLYDVGGIVLTVLPLGATVVNVESALVGALLLAVMLRGNHDAEEMFVVVWAAFVMSAAFTQARFNYYLALAVVALNAYLLGRFLGLMGVLKPDGRIAGDIEPYQVMALMLAVLVVVPGLVVPVELGQAGSQYTTSTAMEVGNNTAPGASVQWSGSLQWMQDNTPAEGEFGGADEPMEVYGTYGVPDGGDFDYSDGAYGVMSWWDYGHWITNLGNRIPNANPFQQGATEAANFLLAPNESQAAEVVSRLSEEGATTRYVMVDWKMVDTDTPRNSKFGAPTVFYDAENLSRTDFISSGVGADGDIYAAPRGQLTQVTTIRKQRYYESLMVRLYRFHGSAVQPNPVVLDWQEREIQGRDGPVTIKLPPQDEQMVKEFDSMEAARAYVRNDSSSMVGGFGYNPSERVPALEHYRLVQASQASATSSGRFIRSIFRKSQLMNVSQREFVRNPNWVKTFERVPGARIEGQGPANETVRASVQMQMANGRNFTYTTRAETGPDGEFTMTVPYSTLGYDEHGPENGHTNVSVRATGPYRFSAGFQQNDSEAWAYTAQANVTEAQVLGEDDSPVTVELERTTLAESDENGTQGNESAPPNSGGNETDGGENDTDASSLSGPTVDGPPVGAEEGDRLPANTPTRAGLLVLLLAGVLVEARDD